MTHLPSSRVPLLLETTKVTKLACSAAKLKGRTIFFVMEKLLIGRSGALLQKQVLENFDRLLSSIDRLRVKFRSIDF